MPVDDVVRDFLADPDNSDDAKSNIRFLMSSHLITGMKFQRQGLMRKAKKEFAKENNRTINSDIDKEIVQKSYVHIGVVYRKLGELENAKAAFQRARELFREYHVGASPHYELAEILIEQGQFDEAIEICKELIERIPHDGGIKQLLQKALDMKKKKTE
jgi:tetratricopeptide (TPR) repeat protein